MIVVKKTVKRWINSINRIIIHLGLNGERFVSLLSVPCLQAIIASCMRKGTRERNRRFNFFIWGEVWTENSVSMVLQLVRQCQTHVHTKKAIKKRLSLVEAFSLPANKNIVNRWWGFTNLNSMNHLSVDGSCKRASPLMVDCGKRWESDCFETSLVWLMFRSILCSSHKQNILCSCLRKLEREQQAFFVFLQAPGRLAAAFPEDCLALSELSAQTFTFGDYAWFQSHLFFVSKSACAVLALTFRRSIKYLFPLEASDKNQTKTFSMIKLPTNDRRWR